MYQKSFVVKTLLITLILFSLWTDIVLAEKINNILIIANNADEEPYQRAIQGFKDELVDKQKPLQFKELYLRELNNNSFLLSKIICENPPDLIYSLVEQAAELAVESAKPYRY